MPEPVDLMVLATAYVDEHIGEFHNKRISAISELSLSILLKKKNPYLFKAKNLEIASDFVRTLLDAHLSSQEETMFGQWLEKLAIYVSGLVDGGQRPATTDIDLDFTREGVRFLVSVKSGPNWGNSSQKRDLREAFKNARRQLQLDPNIHMTFIEGCCYGRQINEDQGTYLKKCGQAFWQFITEDPEFYREIIVPIGHMALEKNVEFASEYARVLNTFTQEFLEAYCAADGAVDWNALLAFNSSAAPLPRRPGRHSRSQQTPR